jgi:hypothetical protein
MTVPCYIVPDEGRFLLDVLKKPLEIQGIGGEC